MATLDVRKIFGVGPVTEKRLHEIGIQKCSDVWNFPLRTLQNELGSFAHWILEASQGLDSRDVETHWERKSMGREETFEKDLTDMSTLQAVLKELSREVSKNLREEGLTGKTIVLKVKYFDFQQITRSHSLPEATQSPNLIYDCAQNLLLNKTEAGKRKIRLIGVSVSNLMTQENACDN
jgi:DNA polymerase-4